VKKKRKFQKNKKRIFEKLLILFLALVASIAVLILLAFNYHDKSLELYDRSSDIVKSIYYSLVPYKIDEKVVLQNDSVRNFLEGEPDTYFRKNQKGLIDVLSSKHSNYMLERNRYHPDFFNIWIDEEKIIILPDHQTSYLRISVPLTKKNIKNINKENNYNQGKLSNSQNAIKLYESISQIFIKSGFTLDEKTTNAMITVRGWEDENAKHFSYISPQGVRCNLSHPKQGKKNDLFAHIYLYCINNEIYQEIKDEQMEILKDLGRKGGINILYNDGKHAYLGGSEILYKDEKWRYIWNNMDGIPCSKVYKYQIPFGITHGYCRDDNNFEYIKVNY